MIKKSRLISLFILAMYVAVMLSIGVSASSTYSVKSGDTLWKISNSTGVSINDLKLINGLQTDYLYVGQVLKLKPDSHLYTVKSGDTLWKISNAYGITVARLKSLNNLTTDSIYVGQALKIKPDTITYSVKSGDMLYKLASAFGTTVSEIKITNGLTSDYLYVGQKLLIPYKMKASSAPVPTGSKPTPIYSWPSVTYTVQSGDYASVISKKFGVPVSDLLKYNYRSESDWFSAGEKIAINGYAPRNYDIYPGMDAKETKYGHLADWFLDGKYVLKRNTNLKVIDLETGKAFWVQVMGGYNHADVEPLTSNDTNIMKSLCTSWSWTPRPVVIYVNGMNIAASISFMPHSFDTISGNGVTGHFDCYLLNSNSHDEGTSQTYKDQHYANVYKAAGIQK